jgi:hypothetical protein
MKQEDKILRIDGVKWWIILFEGVRTSSPTALCPQHSLKLEPKPGLYLSSHGYKTKNASTATMLECAEGPHTITIPREFAKEQKYVIDRLDALTFEKLTVINLDDEAIPVASEELKKDSPFWIKAKLTDSKSGKRLIIWAGDRSKKNKTQLFIEPELKRLSFDQNDDHPTEVFAKVEVTFANNVSATIENK